jgi:hypothetical protein
VEFLEIPLFDDDIFKLVARFTFNLIFLTLIVRFAIFPSQREREFAFTAVMMNVTVFFICFTMKKLELELGMALGLFAIFAVLRYRTSALRVKEMTYLFIVIGIAVINSLSNRKTSYAELVLVNMVIFSAALLKERLVSGQLAQFQLLYDKLEWLGPEHRQKLLADLKHRTGIEVVRVEIERIDLKKANAILKIWFDEKVNLGPPTQVNNAPDTDNSDETDLGSQTDIPSN